MTRFPDDPSMQRWLARLLEAGVPSPASDIRWLQRAAQERGLDSATVDAWVERRARREPLQLVLGEAWFRHIRVTCRAGVFIPRPETEVVAGLAIDRASAVSASRGDVVIVEPCTGTGVITCALVTEVADAAVVAIELDEAAADLASENVAAALAGRAGRRAAPGTIASVRRGHLLDPVDDALLGRIDVLVANPPYLPAGDVGSWDPEVADHDPVAALVGGCNGNELVGDLLDLAARWLRPGGSVVLEIDPRLARDAVGRAEGHGLVGVDVRPDLAGRPRALVARRSV